MYKITLVFYKILAILHVNAYMGSEPLSVAL
jgi:hypothetical protein